jgi:hypothetical protein
LALRIDVKNYITYYIVKETRKESLLVDNPIYRTVNTNTEKGFQKYMNVFTLLKVSLQYIST